MSNVNDPNYETPPGGQGDIEKAAADIRAALPHLDTLGRRYARSSGPSRKRLAGTAAPVLRAIADNLTDRARILEKESDGFTAITVQDLEAYPQQKALTARRARLKIKTALGAAIVAGSGTLISLSVGTEGKVIPIGVAIVVSFLGPFLAYLLPAPQGEKTSRHDFR